MQENASVAEQAPEARSSFIVGIVYIVFPLVFLLVYLIFNTILLIKGEFRTLPAFRLMLYIGILDCVQLICHCYGGVVTIWPSINNDHPLLNRVVGATLNSAWVGLFPLSFVISLYRLLIIRKISKASSNIPVSVKGGTVVSFMYCFAFWICLVTFAEVSYCPTSWAWSYTEQAGSDVMSRIEFMVSMPIVVFTFAIYIAIALTIYMERLRTTTLKNVNNQIGLKDFKPRSNSENSQTNSMNDRRQMMSRVTLGVKTIRKTELQLVIHAAVLFLVLTSLITFWHFYKFILPDSIWTVFAINLYWIIYCGLNPLLYLMCSRKIRRSFLEFIRAKPSRNNVPAVSAIVKRTTQ